MKNEFYSFGFLFRAAAVGGAVMSFQNAVADDNASKRPNVIFVYADDIGYGDLGCNGTSSVKTPNVDRRASEGIRFTNAHRVASTITPSRYSLLTGAYA